MVVITDHHTMDVARIKDLQALAKDKLTVLPGIEFRSELGGNGMQRLSSNGPGLGLEDILLSRRSRKRSSRPVEAAAEHGNGRTRGKSDKNREAYFPTWHDRTVGRSAWIQE